jgi:hypothetical protein
MEFFFAGVLTTLALIVIISIRLHNKRKKAAAQKTIGMTQSSMFLLLKNFMPKDFERMFHKETQAMYFENSKMLNYIEMPDKRVYWMDRNMLYYTDISSGRFDPGEGKPLKIKNIPEKEINKVLYIINSLRDG